MARTDGRHSSIELHGHIIIGHEGQAIKLTSGREVSQNSRQSKKSTLSQETKTEPEPGAVELNRIHSRKPLKREANVRNQQTGLEPCSIQIPASGEQTD